MTDAYTKRTILQGAGTAVGASLSGCIFGLDLGVSEGHIQFFSDEDRDWIEEGQTLRVVGKTGGTKAFERSVRLPYNGEPLTVHPDTYTIYVYLEDELIDKPEWKWEVTSCQSDLYLTFQRTKQKGIIFGTSNC